MNKHLYLYIDIYMYSSVYIYIFIYMGVYRSWLFRFYGISPFVGYLMPNTFLYK